MSLPLVKAHRILAIGLGIFIISHLAIHLSAIGGADVHVGLLSKVQGVYRNWVIEPLLVMAIIVQVCIGAKLVARRWNQSEKGFWGWAQIISGAYLALFLVIHTSAALITRYIIGLDTNFYWAAGTLNINPLQYFFAPYYFTGILCVFVHLASAIYFGWSKGGARLSLLLVIVGLVISGLIVTTFSGGFYEINLPPEVIENFDKYLPN